LFTPNSGTTNEDAALSDGFPKLDDCNDEYYKWEKFSKGYSTIIKTCSLFDDIKLRKAIDENLEIKTDVVECKPCAKLVLEKAIENGKHTLCTVTEIYVDLITFSCSFECVQYSCLPVNGRCWKIDLV
jgi:hypothetical protein